MNQDATPPPLPLKASIEPIQAQFKYTEAEAIRASVRVTNASSPFVRFIPWLGGFALFNLVMGLLITSFYPFKVKPSNDFHTINVFPIFVAVFMALWPLYIRYHAKRGFKKSPDANKIIMWTFSQSLIEHRMTNSLSSFAWNRLNLVRCFKDGFLLYPQPRLAFWIPKHAFTSNANLREFLSLVERSGVKYKNG